MMSVRLLLGASRRPAADVVEAKGTVQTAPHRWRPDSFFVNDE
jgi:hypothetical protein